MTARYGVLFFFFEGNENVLKLTVLIDGQLCE